MKLLKQPNDSCLLYSAAMLLNENPDFLIHEIGHDGQEIWFNKEIGSMRKRSFHIQEIIDCCWRRGHALCPIELYPNSMPESGLSSPRFLYDPSDADIRFLKRVMGRKGILIGRRKTMNLGHAVAWTGDEVYDPAGGVAYAIEDFIIKEAWILTELL